MTTTEQIQALNSAVNTLQLQVGTISSELTAETNRINLHIIDCEDDMSTISARYSLLAAEDTNIHQEINEIADEVDDHEGRISELELKMVEANSAISSLESADVTLQGEITLMGTELHQEIHNVANEVDDHEGRITALETGMVGVGSSISSLEGMDISLQNQITEMDAEHHQELHQLALALDNYSTRINNLELFEAATAPQIVMSEEDYQALGTPDYDTFYYTYEED